MPSPMIGFRAPGQLGEHIAARCQQDTDRANVARRDLNRYYNLLGSELSTVAAQLTASEALALCDMLNTTLVDDELLLVRHLHHELIDAIDDGLADKWTIDGPALVNRVKAWTTGQRLAVVDAVERWWRRAAEDETREASLQAVGLLAA